MKTRALLFAFALSTAPLAAPAHEGGHDARGVITSAGAEELTLRTKQGEEKFAVGKETEFVKDGAPATAQELSVGNRAVVHAKHRNGRMEAIKVEFATAAAPKKK
jgi:Domain of unknown function (DUF5666)